MKKRILSWLALAAFLLSVAPPAAFAGERSLYTDYSDLPAGAWYREGVEDMLAQGLMRGMGGTVFAPEGIVTRAQLVTILYRAAGSPAIRGVGNPFQDVNETLWYGTAVLWGVSQGIVKGVSADRFAPDEPLTRAQLATLLYRFEKALPSAEDHLAVFRDAAQVEPYAREAMNWAAGSGLIRGTSADLLSPAAPATRAQTAVILSRYLKAHTAIPVPSVPPVTE